MRLVTVIGVVVMFSGAIDAAAQAAAADNAGGQEDWPLLYCFEPFGGTSLSDLHLGAKAAH